MIDAQYFDGHSSRPHRVKLLLGGGGVQVLGDGINRRAAQAEIALSEKLGRAPRILRFADGAFCEIVDHAGLEDLLAQAGYRDSAVDLAQRSWLVAVVSLVLTLALLAGGYVWGLPRFADRVAERLPASVSRVLSEQTLTLLDGRLLQPSKTPAARQQELQRRFAALAATAGTAKPKIVFRSSPRIGPNAMALPDGTVVILDELLALADHDEQLLAVLAHEQGHVHHGHGLRLVLRGTLAAAAAAWWLGDVSNLLATAPAALLQAHYSREFETEADAYAVQLLRRNGIAPARLAEMLEKLLAKHGGSKAVAEDEEGWSSYLSSHPATAARIRALKQADSGT